MLCHDRHADSAKNQRNGCNTEDFEGHPVIRAQRAPGDFIGKRGGQEHRHPDPAEGAPPLVRHADLRAHDGADRVHPHQPSTGNDRRQQAGQHRRLDLDEQFIVEIDRQAAKEGHRHASHKGHHRHAALQHPSGGKGDDRRADQQLHRHHEIAGHVIRGEKHHQRPEVGKQLAARLLRRSLGLATVIFRSLVFGFGSWFSHASNNV